MNAVTDILDEARAKPLTLRQITAEAALAQTALSRVIDPVLLRAEGVQLMIGLDAPRPVSDGLPWLHFTLNGAAGAVQLPWGVSRRLAGVPVESSDQKDAALLVEAGIAAWLDEAEAAIGISLRLGHMTPTAPEGGVTTTLNIKGKDKSGGFVEMRQALVLSIPAAASLADALGPRTVSREDLPGLLLRLFWERDTMPMTRAELQGLRPGDALALCDFGPNERVLLEGQMSAAVAPAEPCANGITQLRMISPFHPISTFEETLTMSDTTTTIDHFEAKDAQLDDIDLQLTFRAGEAALPLRKLKTMGPGSIIEMTEPANATVSIMANGRLIGSGELIEIGGRRAVQIRRLFAGS